MTFAESDSDLHPVLKMLRQVSKRIFKSFVALNFATIDIGPFFPTFLGRSVYKIWRWYFIFLEMERHWKASCKMQMTVLALFRIIKLICTGKYLKYIFILKKRFTCTCFTEPCILNFWSIFAALKTIWLASNLLANQRAQDKIKRRVITLNFS